MDIAAACAVRYNAYIYGVSSVQKFIVDNVFHNVSRVVLTVIQPCITQTNVRVIIFVRILKICFPFDVISLCHSHLRKDNPYAPGLAEGQHVSAGDVLGTIIDALRGEPVETVTASESGLVFSQRRYAAVYPGTLIARLCRKERA